MAQKLEKYSRNPADFWLRLQENYDTMEKDHQARREVVRGIQLFQDTLSEYLGVSIDL